MPTATHQSIVRTTREWTGNGFKRSGSASGLRHGARYHLPEMSIWFQRECQTTTSQLGNFLVRTRCGQEKIATRIRDVTSAHEEIQEVDEIRWCHYLQDSRTVGKGDYVKNVCRSPGVSTMTHPPPKKKKARYSVRSIKERNTCKLHRC